MQLHGRYAYSYRWRLNYNIVAKAITSYNDKKKPVYTISMAPRFLTSYFCKWPHRYLKTPILAYATVGV
jgi:hypothetical protein